MELTRLLRVLRDRWYVVVGLGLLGFLAGWFFTNLANENREPQIQGMAAIEFEAQEGDTADSLEAQRDTALVLAQAAAADLMREDPTAIINIEDLTGRLLFTVIAPSEVEAIQRVNALRQAYLDADPVAGADVDALLAKAVEDAQDVQAQIDEIQGTLTPEEQELVAQHANLDALISATQERLVEARLDEATALPADAAAATQLRQQLDDELIDLNTQKAALPPSPITELSVADQMELASLQSAMAVLSAEHEQLTLRKLGIVESARVIPATTDNLTGTDPSALVNGLIGMVAGVAVAIFALVFITRGTKPVWLPEDLEIPFLGQVPARRMGSGVGDAWYDTTEGGARKPAIQALRSVVEAQLPSTGATLAITGHHVSAQGVHALATDLAVSMASAGSTVLLVDADFASDSAVVEYRVGGPSLSGILALNPESLGFERAVASAVSDSLFVRPGLAVVPSGPPPASPGDALAGRQFRGFIEEATKHFDVVVVAVGEMASPAAQVAMQRLRRSILILTPGRAKAPQVNGLVFDVVQRQVAILGAVFLERSERAVWGFSDRQVELHAAPEQTHVAKTQSPVSRLSHYPSLDRGLTGPPQDSLQHLADRIGNLQEEAQTADFGRELLSALDGAPKAVAFEAVADYLVSRVEDMMNANYGEGEFSDAVIDEVSLSGFLPFKSLSEHQSVGRWLMDELHSELAPHTADAIVLEMEEILAAGTGRDVVSVDEWLMSEFFVRHLKRTGGDPSVWHLASEEGAVQVLVSARRFDRQKIENLMTQVTSRIIDEQERTLKATNTRGDEEQAALIEGRIREVRRMETSLAVLLGITVDEETRVSRKRAKGEIWEWNPDWSLGYRANLAPLQRMGLLIFPVLTEEEMNSLVATA
jgi:hypothetical protein